MALNWSKIFQNWTWHNRSQAKDTPLNATNLNKINNAIDILDDRVVSVGESLDTEVVKTTGSQTVGGNKTFSNNISVLKSGENKGYIGLNLSNSGSSIVLKKQDPSDTMTPVSISANALSQYYGTAQTPYRIKLGEYGNSSEKVLISSEGYIAANKLLTHELSAHQYDYIKNTGNLLNGIPAFSTSEDYSVGDVVIYGYVTYKCIVAHSASAWDSTHFERLYNSIAITGDFMGNNAIIAGYASVQNTAEVKGGLAVDIGDFDTTVSYAPNEYVVYNHRLYKCTNYHSGEWNSSHFELSNDIAGYRISAKVINALQGVNTQNINAPLYGDGVIAVNNALEFYNGDILLKDNNIFTGNISKFYSTDDYAVGDYVYRSGKLYICTTTHPAGAWNSSHFTRCTRKIITTGGIQGGSLETVSDIECGGVLKVSGADYAERFETLEDCPIGRFVTLKGEKIKLAQDGDFILGVTSDNPAIIGDKDNIGIPIGVIGKLVVEDDGTAQVDGFAVCGKDGIATAGTGYDCYRVMSRIDENHIRIWVK